MIRLALMWTLCLFLLPVLTIQVWWARLRILRLPEADPPDQGCFGAGEAQEDTFVSILGLGDSVIAGVGCRTLSEAVTAQLAKAIHGATGKETRWKACGRNGDRLADVLSTLSQISLEKTQDIVLVSVGVNDVTRLTSLLKWQLLVTRLVADLKEKFSCKIIFLAVPPMNLFTGLPQPLRFTLGVRAAMLDLSLKRVGELLDYVVWVPSDVEESADMLAEDGYHPSPLACEKMAQNIVRRLQFIK